VVQSSIVALLHGLKEDEPYDMHMSMMTIGILVVAILMKMFLWWYCEKIGECSPTALALAQDHRNDVMSNSMALATSLIAQYKSKYWFADPLGAIMISLYITVSWMETGKEQVERLVGIQADEKFITFVSELADDHHPLMKSDIVRAYHFGNNFLVEIEVILPQDMRVREAHDISLALQMKVEALETVERAFVHVDYLPRNYDEHKDPTVRRRVTSRGESI